MVPGELRYTKDHEWVRLEGDVATIGITDFAAGQLGDVVFVDLPAVGATLAEHGTFGVVESVKAVSDLFTPLPGTVTETNGELGGRPELVNEDPYGAGWMIKVRVADAGATAGLLDAAAYERLTAEG
ncbi:MAG: glycine cleavage system protein GcvH [Chloroflexota bacterium]|jgi:glycine cleavage system H protein